MILVTAATRWESRPLIRTWKLHPQEGKMYKGSALGKDLCLLETGIGPEKTQAALRNMRTPVELVISSGFAGALQPGIKSGELVADPYGAPLELLDTIRRAAQKEKAVIHLGRMISASRVADPKHKSALGKNQRAVAVDMESHVLRQWAQSHGTPFLALRVVLDDLEESLPENFPAEESSGAQLRYFVQYGTRRWENILLLLKLAFLQRKAMRTLKRFLNRFLLESP